jgi:hypothetical protein
MLRFRTESSGRCCCFEVSAFCIYSQIFKLFFLISKEIHETCEVALHGWRWGCSMGRTGRKASVVIGRMGQIAAPASKTKLTHRR